MFTLPSVNCICFYHSIKLSHVSVILAERQLQENPTEFTLLSLGWLCRFAKFYQWKTEE